jgi:hypothetical protein
MNGLCVLTEFVALLVGVFIGIVIGKRGNL